MPTYAAAALAKLDLVVYLNTTLNTGHAHGLAAETIILPVLARDEEPQPTTQESMFNYVRLSDGGPRAPRGPAQRDAKSSPIWLAGCWAMPVRSIGSGWSRRGRYARRSPQIVPGWEQFADIDRTKQRVPRSPAGGSSSRVSRPPRARLLWPCTRCRNFAGGDGQLRLMTVRSEGQFNTVVYEDADLYRGQQRRDVILIHSDDLRRLKIEPDSRVTVRSAAGALVGVIARAFDKIKPGNVLMYYPEANVLVPKAVDQRSRTPAFKNVTVRLEPAAASVVAGMGAGMPHLNGNGATPAAPRGNLKAC